MVIEREIESFFGWLLAGESWKDGALVQFALTFGAVSLLALAVGFLVLLIRYGPLRAGELAYRTISTGLGELARISPGRVRALATLAVKESLRRRVLVGLVVFVAVLAFAGWFLSTEHQDPGKLYVSVVLTATSYLTLLLALLLSTFSLPGEFKSKTIYTIVTKPVRAGDIVLGRMLGFTAIGTFMLAVMGVLSYLFVQGSLDHTHELDAASLEEIVGGDGDLVGLRGTSSYTMGHSHPLELNADGVGEALSEHGHDHAVLGMPSTPEADAAATTGALNILRARVPQRGTLRFLDRNGVIKERGVNVGSEWTYRSFVEGGTQAAAVWTFSGVDASVLAGPEEARYLPLELIVRVFRTHKGDVTRPIQGSIQLRNPDTKLTNSIETFGAKDYTIDLFEFPVEQFDSDNNPIDLLEDLVSESGQIEVIVQSLERAQYYGFAQADCYIRLPESSPVWNFVKGYLSLWVQMVVVIAIGVTASTFLNGPIAMLFTTSFVLLGFYRDFLIGIATGVQPDGEKVYGGGPVEAFVRIWTQMNLMTDFDTDTQSQTIGINLMKGVDDVLQTAMQAIAYILPDFRTLSSVNYVAEGFSIPGPVIGRELAVALAYVVGLSVAGYFLLRTREIAK